MATSDLFDAENYFTALTLSNRLAVREKFYPCMSSGPASLEGVINNLKTQSAFVCIDDTNESTTYSRGSGFFVRRVFTVHILMRYKQADLVDRKQKLAVCRRLFRQFHSRIIRDKYSVEQLYYVDERNVMSRDYGQYFLNGITGLYFVLQSNEPIDLCYNLEEWTT